MARQKAGAKYLGFPKGLNTETSVLNPEQGTTADELNMDLRLNNLIRVRRLGLENVGTNQGTTGDIIGGWYWESADTFVLIGLSILDSPSTTDLITVYLYDGELDYIEEWTVKVLKGDARIPNFSDIRNRMIITFGTKPFVFAKQSSGCFDAWYLDLFFRDFKLLDDGLRISQRPTTMDSSHTYNVYNAGWYQDVQLQGGAEKIASTALFDDIGEYPSNADVVSLGITASSSGTTIFNPQSLETSLTGNSEAPRGHYVFNTRQIDRQNKTSNRLLDGVPSKTITKVLSCSVNATMLGGNLLYVDTAPTGISSDPPNTGGSGGSGSDPLPFPPGYWELP